MMGFGDYFKIVSVTAGLLCFGVSGSLAQLTIAPTYIFLDNQNRFATMLVMNGGEKTQEVSIEYQFGYPESASDGSFVMNYSDSATAEKYSISNWIRGFPQNFTLQPGQRQVVRFTVRPPSDLEDGVYWTRIKTASSPLSPPVEATSDDRVTAQINIRVEQITTAIYSKGNNEAALSVSNLELINDGAGGPDSLSYDVTKTGTAPYLGTFDVKITDPSGNTVYQNTSTTSIYFDVFRKIPLNTNGLEAGTYRVQLTYAPTRRDIAQDKLFKANTVTKNISFSVN